MVWWGVITATIVLGAPISLAVWNDRQIASFQGYTFGHLARAGRNFRVMNWAVFAFYVGIVASDLALGSLPLMWNDPGAGDAVALYVRIGAVGVAYGFALFVSKELHNVTKTS